MVLIRTATPVDAASLLEIYRPYVEATAVSFVQGANDQLAEAVRRHPTRLAGMIAIAPQDPAAAAKEIERGVSKLGMHSVIINSHTQGEYLSDPKFWDIFAAAEANDAPIYLHPNALPPGMLQPFQECGLDGAIYGFGVETGLHAMRIITAPVMPERWVASSACVNRSIINRRLGRLVNGS